jgi:hypothetical protein
MLDLPRAPDSVKPPDFPMLRLGAAAPKCIVKPIDFENARERQSLVICLSFSKTSEKLSPSFTARAIFANAVECGCQHGDSPELSMDGALQSVPRSNGYVLVCADPIAA